MARVHPASKACARPLPTPHSSRSSKWYDQPTSGVPPPPGRIEPPEVIPEGRLHLADPTLPQCPISSVFKFGIHRTRESTWSFASRACVLRKPLFGKELYCIGDEMPVKHIQCRSRTGSRADCVVGNLQYCVIFRPLLIDMDVGIAFRKLLQRIDVEERSL